jgi:ribulose-phosphate 3-epimerase
MQIIPTVTEKDFYKAEARILDVSQFSRWIQVDVIDNIFAPGLSFSLELINKLGFATENLLWDVHLLVKEPSDWIEKCLFIGASRITGQVEMMKDREAFVKTIRDEGLEAGLAFDIETEVKEIPLETSLVILMGRKAGFGWFDLDERVYEKIDLLKNINEEREQKFLIAIDGGVNIDNIDKLKETGTDVIYSGGNYFQLKDAE